MDTGSNTGKIVNELHFKIEQENEGLSAYCDHIGVYTIGKGFAELKENVRKAINIFYKDYPKDSTTQITIQFIWPAKPPEEEQIRLA